LSAAATAPIAESKQPQQQEPSLPLITQAKQLHSKLAQHVVRDNDAFRREQREAARVRAQRGDVYGNGSGSANGAMRAAVARAVAAARARSAASAASFSTVTSDLYSALRDQLDNDDGSYDPDQM
jgi:hypothetical protein